MPTEMKWKSYTDFVNRIEKNSTFLGTFFAGISQDRMFEGEELELSYYDGQRKMAPFVRVGAEAKMIQGPSKSFAMVKGPNIRIKMPYHPHGVLNERLPGTSAYPTRAERAAAIRRDKQLHFAELTRQADERVEWMWAQSLKGKIEYSRDEGDSFEIDFRRPAANTITLAGTDLWSDTANADPRKDIVTAERLIVPKLGSSATHVLMGRNAAEALLEIEKVQKHLERDSAFSAGSRLDLTGRLKENGGRLVANNLYGLEWWEYDRQTLDDDGSTVDLVDPDSIFVLSRSRALMPRTFYAAIPDLDAFGQSNLGMLKRFAKSWITKDPSQEIHLLHTRPFPYFQRPEGVVQIKVLA